MHINLNNNVYGMTIQEVTKTWREWLNFEGSREQLRGGLVARLVALAAPWLSTVTYIQRILVPSVNNKVLQRRPSI